MEEKEVSKIYNILKNWHVHYGEVYQQLTKSRDNLTKLYNVQRTSTNLQLPSKIEQEINMKRMHIDQLQEEENQWLQNSRTSRVEVHRLVERSCRLLSQVNEYNSMIGTTLATLHDEPLELKLQYLIEIKALSASITILLANWHALKSQLITNDPAMLKILASDGPIADPHS